MVRPGKRTTPRMSVAPKEGRPVPLNHEVVPEISSQFRETLRTSGERHVPQTEGTPQVASAARENIVALPGHRFYSTQIPVRRWFLPKTKNADAKDPFRIVRAAFVAGKRTGMT